MRKSESTEHVLPKFLCFTSKLQFACHVFGRTHNHSVLSHSYVQWRAHLFTAPFQLAGRPITEAQSFTR